MRHGIRHVACCLFLTLAVLGCRQPTHPTVTIETSVGRIVIELYENQAPLTVKNFLAYVERNAYDNATFYRVVRDDNQAQNNILIDVVQGGLGFDRLTEGLPPIAHESTQQSGLRHEDGTLSLARGEPGTGASEFFICIGAQPALDAGGLRNPDGLGFAAFGSVVEGMEIIRQIHRMPTVQPDGELEYTSGQMLIDPPQILSIKR
ncbi:MAG: peptidylprolyl isomerase [Woeseiaceae bacterium]